MPFCCTSHCCPEARSDQCASFATGTGPVVLFQTMQTIGSALGYNAWASMKAGHLPALFSNKMVTKHQASNKFSCQASDLLGISPVVRHYLHTIIIPAGGPCRPA